MERFDNQGEPMPDFPMCTLIFAIISLITGSSIILYGTFEVLNLDQVIGATF